MNIQVYDFFNNWFNSIKLKNLANMCWCINIILQYCTQQIVYYAKIQKFW